MIKPLLLVFAAAALAGCGTVIDFGPEPGTPGDPAYWHYQPELHGPNAPPRANRADNAPASPAAEAPGADAAAPNPAASSAGQPGIPAAPPALPAPPPPSAAPPAPVSETMFNDAIRRAVASGEIDRALRLLEEAERLGSQSARPAFIDALEGREEN
ncbi:hypothetical protein [Wenzhouxiangella sp. XN24]|uniref:hypothetical protein n=1 Tax=Wenzhouxiangella sp. XN24 TaxID=2713569 RepID=UPI0013ED2DC4|nr:hypothetical protein [Wenzhouxiangella sp. XN24]NGX17049.1 hypothetical protein [Wenzhouxiangella sp. XN24]